ncbi:DnaJ [Trichinella pseudospiralis]
MCRYFSTAHIHAYASFSTTEYLRSAAASVGEPKLYLRLVSGILSSVYLSRFFLQWLLLLMNPDRTTIKKAYYKASLKYHPDRVHGKDEKELATKKFQILSKAFDVLYDEDKRAAYDEMGLVDNDWLSHVSDWMTFWRTLFKPVEKQDIDSFYANYIGSEEERYDLKKAYLAKKGDMDYIVDTRDSCLQTVHSRRSK